VCNGHFSESSLSQLVATSEAISEPAPCPRLHHIYCTAVSSMFPLSVLRRARRVGRLAEGLAAELYAAVRDDSVFLAFVRLPRLVESRPFRIGVPQALAVPMDRGGLLFEIDAGEGR